MAPPLPRTPSIPAAHAARPRQPDRMDDDQPLLHEPDLMLALVRAARERPAGLDAAADRLAANLAAAHAPAADPAELRRGLARAAALLQGAGVLSPADPGTFRLTEFRRPPAGPAPGRHRPVRPRAPAPVPGLPRRPGPPARRRRPPRVHLQLRLPRLPRRPADGRQPLRPRHARPPGLGERLVRRPRSAGARRGPLERTAG